MEVRAAPPAAVDFDSVIARRGRFPALAGVSLCIRSGEIVALRGPNGAGKTTLLRALAGLVPLSGRRAVVLGVDLLRERRAVRPCVGWLGHRPALYADLTVGDQLRYCAAATGAAPSAVSAAAQRLAIDDRLLGVTVGALSEGQQRRVALACLVVARPTLWLLDEPHAGLDAASRVRLDDLLADAADAGATVIYASHETPVGARSRDRQIGIVGGAVTGG